MSRAKKIHAILPPEEWHYLEELIAARWPNVPRIAWYEKLEDMVCKQKPNDRFYLSKWLEQFIILYAKANIERSIAKKVDNRGKAIMNKVVGGKSDGKILGVMGYRKDANQIVGEPDVRVLIPRIGTVYFEVKIGNDRLSPEQQAFIDSGFAKVYVVKTVKDVIDAFNDLLPSS